MKGNGDVVATQCDRVVAVRAEDTMETMDSLAKTGSSTTQRAGFCWASIHGSTPKRVACLNGWMSLHQKMSLTNHAPRNPKKNMTDLAKTNRKLWDDTRQGQNQCVFTTHSQLWERKIWSGVQTRHETKKFVLADVSSKLPNQTGVKRVLKQKNMVMGPDGARNREWLCCRKPATNY
jgi:hypothetical protein